MSKFADRQFWIDAADRALSTFAQTFVATLIATSVTTVIDLEWSEVSGIAALAALISLGQSISARGGSTPDKE